MFFLRKGFQKKCHFVCPSWGQEVYQFVVFLSHAFCDQFAPAVQGLILIGQVDVSFLPCTQVTLSLANRIRAGSSYHWPFNAKVFVFLFKFANMGSQLWLGGPIINALLVWVEWCAMGIPPLLKTSLGLPCVCFDGVFSYGLVVVPLRWFFFSDFCSINHPPEPAVSL